jgi:hypothetical protein
MTQNVTHRFGLGVIWCRYPNEHHNGDGRHLSYLDREDFAVLDPELHAAMRGLIQSGRRSLSAIEQGAILPKGTIYFRDPTSFANVVRSIASKRSELRCTWRKHALDKTRTAEIVFFDPDNGLEAASVSQAHPKAGKYIFWDDLTPFWARGQSLVVYHHLNRTAPAKMQTEALKAHFKQRLGDIPLLLPLLFRRGSCRHFWIVGQSAHAAHLEKRVSHFLSNGWNGHFEPG